MSTTADDRAPLGGSGSAADDPAVWLRERGLELAALTPLTGDLSARRYARVRLAGEERGRILARYPESMRDAQRRFAAAAGLLAEAGIRVPEVAVDDPVAGYSLLEDLGPKTLYESLEDWSAGRSWLAGSTDVVARLRRLDAGRVAALGSPALDADLLRAELDRPLRLLLVPARYVDDRLASALGELCERLGGQSLVPCHRDFMARNLVPLDEGRVGVLDFQDLRLGPPEYDLASLLNDSLFADAEVEDAALADPALGGSDRERYGRAVVQRSLKAAGTFVALAEQGKRQHLPLVARSLERAARHLERLPETAAAFRPLAERWRERRLPGGLLG